LSIASSAASPHSAPSTRDTATGAVHRDDRRLREREQVVVELDDLRQFVDSQEAAAA
jgi:hypothetical protein